MSVIEIRSFQTQMDNELLSDHENVGRRGIGVRVEDFNLYDFCNGIPDIIHKRYIFCRLNRRVDRIEHSISVVVTRIDTVLTKLEAMEKTKLRQQQEVIRRLQKTPQVNKLRLTDDRSYEYMHKFLAGIFVPALSKQRS
jgi:hypothetical protein